MILKKKIPASACRKKCMQHKCNRKKILHCCEKNILLSRLLEKKKILADQKSPTHPPPPLLIKTCHTKFNWLTGLLRGGYARFLCLYRGYSEEQTDKGFSFLKETVLPHRWGVGTYVWFDQQN